MSEPKRFRDALGEYELVSPFTRQWRDALIHPKSQIEKLKFCCECSKRGFEIPAESWVHKQTRYYAGLCERCDNRERSDRIETAVQKGMPRLEAEQRYGRARR